MKESKFKKQIHKILKKIICDHILVRLGELPEENDFIRCSVHIEESKLSDHRKRITLDLLSFILLEVKERTLDESIKEIQSIIEDEGITATEFMKEVVVTKEDTASMMQKVIFRKLTFKLDETKKEVGQKVTISHASFTSLLVTDDGVQIKSKNLSSPAIPELMGQVATVIEIDCEGKEYLCGVCDKKHIADVKIAFEDYNMEFYIANDFLKCTTYEE